MLAKKIPTRSTYGYRRIKGFWKISANGIGWSGVSCAAFARNRKDNYAWFVLTIPKNWKCSSQIKRLPRLYTKRHFFRPPYCTAGISSPGYLYLQAYFSHTPSPFFVGILKLLIIIFTHFDGGGTTLRLTAQKKKTSQWNKSSKTGGYFLVIFNEFMSSPFDFFFPQFSSHPSLYSCR